MKNPGDDSKGGLTEHDGDGSNPLTADSVIIVDVLLHVIKVQIDDSSESVPAPCPEGQVLLNNFVAWTTNLTAVFFFQYVKINSIIIG